MINLTSKITGKAICLPERIDEIKPEYFDALLANVHLPKFYSIVGICYNTKLYDFAITVNNNKTNDVSVTPVIAKINEDDAKAFNAKVMDRIVIDRSALERGHHININSVITANNFGIFLINNENLLKAIIRKDENVLNKEILNSSIILVEFKIIPVNDINGVIDKTISIIDPFDITNPNC